MSKHATLLIMTDDPNQRLALSEFLGYEYQILTAENGEEGFDIFSQHEKRVAVLITELRALRTTGLDLLTQKKQELPSLQILVIKGFDTQPLSPELEERTTVTYIQEPFTYHELTSHIERAISRRTSGRNRYTLSFSDIFQLYCISQARTALSVVRQPQGGQEERGKIYFDAGHVIHAMCGKMKGENGLYYMMSWDTPTFFPRYGVTVKQRAIRTDWEDLLLNAQTYIMKPSPVSSHDTAGTDELETFELKEQEEGSEQEGQPDNMPGSRSDDSTSLFHVSPQLQEQVSQILIELQEQFDGMEMALVVDLHGNLISSVSNDVLQPKLPLLNSLLKKIVWSSTDISRTLQLGAIEELVVIGQQQDIAMLFPLKDFGNLGVVASKGSQGMMRWNCMEAIEKLQGLV